MFTRSNSYVGYIIVLIDVTKDVEMDQLRSNFISNVSHELRTPVTVLRSYIDTLYSYGNDFDFNTQREFIGVMNQEIIRLNRMVNDILDFSRYEAQNVKLEKTKTDIIEIVEDAVNQVQVLAKEHDLINFYYERAGFTSDFCKYRQYLTCVYEHSFQRNKIFS